MPWQDAAVPPNPTFKSLSVFFDSVLYFANGYFFFDDFIQEELGWGRAVASNNSLLWLEEKIMYEDQSFMKKVHAQLAFLKVKSPTIMAFKNYLQERVLHRCMERWTDYCTILIRFNCWIREIFLMWNAISLLLIAFLDSKRFQSRSGVFKEKTAKMETLSLLCFGSPRQAFCPSCTSWHHVTAPQLSGLMINVERSFPHTMKFLMKKDLLITAHWMHFTS